MKRLNGPALFLVAVVAATPGSLFGQTMICTMKPSQSPYYTAPELRIVLGDNGKAAVTDAVIRGTDRERVFSDVVTDTPQKLGLRWRVDGVETEPGRSKQWKGKLVVQLTVKKANGSATMNVLDTNVLWGDNDTYRTTGTCSPGP
jgi:hypothetical protein